MCEEEYSKKLQNKILKSNFLMMLMSIVTMAVISLIATFAFREAYHHGNTSPMQYVIRLIIAVVLIGIVLTYINAKRTRKMVQQMQKIIDAEIEKNKSYERARIALVAGISHDLRTPLTSIKGYIGGLKDGIANTPEKQKQYLDTAYKKSIEMEKLLSRLLYFSKLETGNLPNEQVEIDFGEMVENYAEEMKQELEAKNAKLLFEKPKEKLQVFIDVNQMLRVFDNLLTNALKYAGNGATVITMKAFASGEDIHFVFADNGKGVEEDKLPYIFELFYRADSSRTSKSVEGSGLGLYIVKQIVENQNGQIKAYNNNGFVVEITFPKSKGGK